MHTLHIMLFGGCALSVDGAPGPPFPTDKTRALLAYLALTPDKPVTRSVLAGMLWPDVSDKTARANLRVTLYRLNQLLNSAQPATGSQILTATRQAVQFHTEGAAVDVLVFEAKMREVAAHDHPALSTCDSCLSVLREAVACYQGELLAGLSLDDAPAFEEWLFLRREYLHQQAVRAAEELAAALESRQLLDEGLAVAQRLLELDNFREESHRLVMRLLARRGMREEALRQYDTLRGLLHTEMGVEPTETTNDLVRRISSGQISSGQLEEIPAEAPATGMPPSNWSQAPVVGSLFGREAASEELERWLLDEHCRAIALLGMGGVGKSTLAAHLMRGLAGRFDVALWYSLLNGLPLGELLTQILGALTQLPRTELPERLDDKLSLLLTQLRRWRCLLVLDNVETILQPAENGQFRPGYDEYGQFFDLLSTRDHASVLLFTSRERPKNFARIEKDFGGVRSLVLSGLDDSAVRQILQARGLDPSPATAQSLGLRYSGNPLALNLVGQVIADFYAGHVDDFLATPTPIFDDIRDVIHQQIVRLTPLEREIMTWLAIARRPLSLVNLRAHLLNADRPRELLEAMSALQRRSLLEKAGAGFTLQNVIIEYMTEEVVEAVVEEILQRRPDAINRFCLLDAQAYDYIRASQARMLLGPICERLQVHLAKPEIGETVRELLMQLRGRKRIRPGYAAGNLLDLLLYMDIDPASYDFSHLSVWQSSLQGHMLPRVNFAGADLRDTVFDNSFGMVWTVACSPRGEHIAAGSIDGRVTLWNAQSAEQLASWSAHASAVYALAFSPDGLLLVSGGADGLIRFWDIGAENRYGDGDGSDPDARHASGPDLLPFRMNARERRKVAEFSGHTAAVQQVLFRAPSVTRSDEWELISASDDLTIRVWHVASGETRRILRGHRDFVVSAALSPDGRWLASGSRGQSRQEHTLCLWDLADGALLCTIEHAAWVNGVAISPNGQWLASGASDGTVRLWPFAALLQGKDVALDHEITLQYHEGAIQSLAFSADSHLLASGGTDRTIRLWDVGRKQLRHVLTGHTGWAQTIAFDPGGDMLVSGSWDCTVRQWDSRKGHALRTIHGGTTGVFCVAFSPDGQRLASTGSDGVARVWDVTSGEVVQNLPRLPDMGWRVVFSPDGRLLADTNFTGDVRIWEAGQTGKTRSDGHWRLFQRLAQMSAAASGLAFDARSEYLASTFLDGTVLVIDLAQLSSQDGNWAAQRLTGHKGWALAASFRPDGQQLASSGADHRVILWNLSTGEIDTVLEGHGNGVQEVAYSPDGSMLASAGWDHTVRIWEVNGGRLLHLLTGHTDIAQSVAFSPDGRTLASCSYDGAIRLWDVASGQVRYILDGHGNWVHYVTFSPDGRLLASGGADGTIKLWDPRTGACLETWRMPGPYEGMNITGATGITDAQRASLLALGATEDESPL